MSEYLIIIGLITIAILVIHELVRSKIALQFNIINLVYHIIAAFFVFLGGYVTAVPDVVRVILIVLGLIGLGFGFRLQKRQKSERQEVVE